MSWVRIDDGFADHPKIVKLNHLEFRLHIWGLCYCARHLTDGFLANVVPRGAHFVPRSDRRQRVINGLLEAGLWEQVDGGYIIRDYLDYNPDAASVKEKRQQNADRVARHREAQKRRSNGRGNALQKKPVMHPPSPPQKAGEKGAAPGGASLPFDDCMRCGERRPLNDHDGSLLCDECERAAA